MLGRKHFFLPSSDQGAQVLFDQEELNEMLKSSPKGTARDEDFPPSSKPVNLMYLKNITLAPYLPPMCYTLLLIFVSSSSRFLPVFVNTCEKSKGGEKASGQQVLPKKIEKEVAQMWLK